MLPTPGPGLGLHTSIKGAVEVLRSLRRPCAAVFMSNEVLLLPCPLLLAEMDTWATETFAQAATTAVKEPDNTSGRVVLVSCMDSMTPSTQLVWF